MGVPGSSPCLTRERRLAPGALHPGVELRANRRSIHHRCRLFQVAFVLELTKETIYLPLGCLQHGISHRVLSKSFCRSQLPQQSVNVSLTITKIKNKSTELCGNSLLQNDFTNTLCEISACPGAPLSLAETWSICVPWCIVCARVGMPARYKGISFIRDSAPLGPYCRDMPRALLWS